MSDSKTTNKSNTHSDTNTKIVIKEKKLTFKQKMMIQREELIIETVNNLLSTKGYDAMTVDEIADIVGIAKASLYRHFSGKEALAIGALINSMDKGLNKIAEINATDKAPIDKIVEITQWAMTLKLNQQMPNLPSENSQLRELLMDHESYMDMVVNMSDSIGEWIEDAQKSGDLSDELTGICILYTIFARACDPVLGFLKQSGMFSDEQIITMVTRTCFKGLAS